MRLIDADELIESINNMDNWLSQMDLAQFNIYSLINTMPTVERQVMIIPDRPHGEWISLANGNGINCGRKCSLCGKTVEFSENFCPQCGADMRGNDNG